MTAVDFDTVSLREASRVYGRRRALSPVSLTFRAGEIAVLLGPNGAGKSTLLGLLASLGRPSSGTVEYGSGGLGARAADVRARVGWLGHDPGLYPELSARQNLEFFARLHAVPASVVPAALARAGLADRDAEPVLEFSRGMKQRLALERALLHGPRLVLLDEPFTGLDRYAGDALAGRLAGLRETGRIVVFATHDLEAAEAVCDRVVVLQDGRMLADEPARRPLRDQYLSRLASGERAGRG